MLGIIIQTIFIPLQKDNQLIDLLIEPDVAVSYILLDSELFSGQSVQISCRIRMEQRCKVDFLLAFLHVQNCTIDLELDCSQDDSSANVVVLYGLSGSQKITINTVQKHVGKHTCSNVVARGILMDKSQAQYTGLISIQPGSRKAIAAQEHATILLSRHGKVVSVPSIEVLHHDVQCLHGSAIGQFQEQQLWYLQSRGLTRNLAYRLLVHSFFAHYVNRFSVSGELLESLCKKIV